MSTTLDYYLSLQSPWTYLGHQRLADCAAKAGYAVRISPIDFSVVFPATGGLPLPKRSAQRQAYRMAELDRWREHLDVDLNLEPAFFPVADRLAACCVISVRDDQSIDQGVAGRNAFALAGSILKAVWSQEKNIADESVLAELIEQSNSDAQSVLDSAKSDQTAATFLSDSNAAIERGVFGAPTYAVGDQLFWGQDRLQFVESALKA